MTTLLKSGEVARRLTVSEVGMRTARVFPRRIKKATPSGDLVFTREPGLFRPDVDEVHISVTFTWDLPRAHYLAEAWKAIAPVKIGGPATGMRGESFVPGMYLKKGYVITSRGCPNNCWFCEVPKREGNVRELPITEGWNVLDDNLLACSEKHILEVVDMLRGQKHKAEFTGGLEAARLTNPIAHALRSIKPDSVFFAYDTPDDWEPLVNAAQMLWNVGFPVKKHCVRAYVLIGYPKDTLRDAERRLRAVLSLGVMPFAMLWREKTTGMHRGFPWADLQRKWARPAIIARVA